MALFPALAAHARSTTRLHPRPGAPAAAHSSVGGPLLWPAGEPWPLCDDPHDDVRDPSTPASVWRRRAILDAAWHRTPRGEDLRISDAERAELDELEETRTRWTATTAPPMEPLLTVFYCPRSFDHPVKTAMQ